MNLAQFLIIKNLDDFFKLWYNRCDGLLSKFILGENEFCI